jgi:TRAP-type C4-dicarboxylate transport system substrate-binding protein
VFGSMAAASTMLSIRDTLHEVQRGSVDAALSSGDGQSSRDLGRELRNFTAKRYAYPLSFIVVQQSALDALAPETQQRYGVPQPQRSSTCGVTSPRVLREITTK